MKTTERSNDRRDDDMMPFTFDILKRTADCFGRWRGGVMSPPERLFYDTYQRLGLLGGRFLPQDEISNTWIVDGARHSYRYYPDFSDRDRKIIIEIDGLTYHSGQDTIMKDHRRQRQLERDGWRFIRFAAKEILDDPVRCVKEAVLSVNAIV